MPYLVVNAGMVTSITLKNVLMKARCWSICHNCGRTIVEGDDLRTDYDNKTARWKAIHDDCADLKSLEGKSEYGSWGVREENEGINDASRG